MLKSKFSLLFIDIIFLYVSIVLAVVFRGILHNREIQTMSEWVSAHTNIFLPSFIFAIFAMYIAGLYDIKILYDRAKTITLFLYTQFFVVLFAILSFYLLHTNLTPKLTLFLYICFSSVLLIFIRLIFTFLILRIKKPKAFLISNQNTFLDKNLQTLNINYGLYEISPVVFSNLKELLKEDEKKKDVNVFIYDSNLLKDTENFLLFEKFKHKNFEIISSEEYFEYLYKKVDIDNFDVEKFKIDFMNKKETTGHYLFRRFLDISSAIAIFPIFLISIPIVCIMNFFGNKGKLFSIQNRVSELEKVVNIYKIRTMLKTDDGGVSLDGEIIKAHIESNNGYTKLGMFLRKTRIDELPQVINLIKGDISIVGPRADVIGVYNDMSSEIDFYKLRMVVQQGLTGWAQVHMSTPPRKKEEYIERLAYELYYIKHRSIFLDLSIILKTIKVFLSRQGA